MSFGSGVYNEITVEMKGYNMTRLKELLKNKKVVAGVAAVIVLIAVGTTAVCVTGGNKQTAAQETKQQTTTVATAKKTEQTTAAMEIAQAQTGAGETTTVATAVAEETKVENDSQTEEATAEIPQQAEPVEEAQLEEIPHGEEVVSENTGNDTEESNEPEEAPAPEPTPEPATEAAQTLTDEERLVSTGKWVLTDTWGGNSYTYTDSITGYTMQANFNENGKYCSGQSNSRDELKAILAAHGVPDGTKLTIDTYIKYL